MMKRPGRRIFFLVSLISTPAHILLCIPGVSVYTNMH